MTDVNKAVEYFINTCHDFSISQLPSAKTELIFSDEIKLAISNSKELNVCFSKFIPSGEKIETGFTPIKLFSASQLDKAQVGYENFPKEFLVFADDNGGGKPIIAVTNQVGTPVYANYDTEEPFAIADDLGCFFLAMSELIKIVYENFEIFDIADENDELKPDFIKESEERLIPVLGNEMFSAFFDYFYG